MAAKDDRVVEFRPWSGRGVNSFMLPALSVLTERTFWQYLTEGPGYYRVFRNPYEFTRRRSLYLAYRTVTGNLSYWWRHQRVRR